MPASLRWTDRRRARVCPDPTQRLGRLRAAADNQAMELAQESSPVALDEGNHFSCSLSAVLLAMLRSVGGQPAVDEVLRISGCRKSLDYLEDIANWLSFEEAIALLDAGQEVTGDELFARHVGERAIPTVTGSPVAEMLRALGSPEEAYRRIPATSAKMNLVTRSEARE